MRIPICHQFWENGENARWMPQVFPVEKLEWQIKADYQALATERPTSKQYGEYTVFFDYRPAKDIFGRNIVPISFAFYKDFPNDRALARQIHTSLANAPNSQIWLDLPDRAQITTTRKRKKAPVKLIILLLAAILALGILLKSCGSKNPAPAEQARPAPTASNPAHTASVPPTANIPANIPAAQNAPQVKPPENPSPVAPNPPVQAPLADICKTPQLWQSLLKCPRAFVEKRCRGEISIDFRAFRKNDAACRPAYGKAAPWSRNLPIFREGASPKGRATLENFIFGN